MLALLRACFESDAFALTGGELVLLLLLLLPIEPRVTEERGPNTGPPGDAEERENTLEKNDVRPLCGPLNLTAAAEGCG